MFVIYSCHNLLSAISYSRLDDRNANMQELPQFSLVFFLDVAKPRANPEVKRWFKYKNAVLSIIMSLIASACCLPVFMLENSTTIYM